MIKNYGTDALRLFILFAAPPEKEFAWSEDGIEGSYRFLARVWQVFQENRDLFEIIKGETVKAAPLDPASYARLQKKMHQTIKKVSEDIGKRFHLNTAISAIMEFTNTVKKEKDSLKGSEAGRALLKDALKSLVLLLSPFTPHLCEEIWQNMGQAALVYHAPWPAYDPGLAKEEKATIVVEINGKIRDKFEAGLDITEGQMQETALGLDRIRALIGGRPVKKVVCIRNKIINIVI